MRPIIAALVLLSTAMAAAAQVVLPGAVAPTPEGAQSAPNAAPAARRPKPRPSAGEAASGTRSPDTPGDALPSTGVPVKPAAASSLAGQTLYREGRQSQITFELRDKTLVVSRLTLAGQARDGSECRVDVADLPVPVRDEGQPDGMARIGIPLPACPISFDVLDGAALATGDGGLCTFKSADCRIDTAGLWGPPAASLGPDRDKLIERERTRAEAAVRGNYKRLVSTTKDRPTIMGYAREQAQFSSTREEICRGYAGEIKHGFCATRVTQARAAALGARTELGQTEKDRRRRRAPRKV